MNLMGTLVASMPPDGMADAKKLHPFFVPSPNGAPCSRTEPEIAIASAPTRHENGTGGEVIEQTNDQDGPKRKRRKTDPTSLEANHESTPPGSKKRQTTLKGTTTGSQPSIVGSLVQPVIPQQQVSSAREQVFQDAPSASSAPFDPQATPPQQPSGPLTPQVNGTQTPPVQSEDSKPKRVLRLNPKTGTIGSPPKPRTKPGQKGKQAPFIVTLRFGHDKESRDRIGQQIGKILSTPPPPKAPGSKKRGRPTKASQEKAKDAKTTQPRINDTKTSPPANAAPQRQTIFSSTPCSPKKSRPILKRANLPQFGVKSIGLRVPGSAHPAWPWKGAVHVTGESDGQKASAVNDPTEGVTLKKSKGRAVAVSQQESVVDNLGTALQMDGIRHSINTSSDGFDPPPAELRLPSKHFESGPKLQRRIQPELRTPIPRDEQSIEEESDDDIVAAPTRAPRAHPSIARLYRSLTTSLSAFDRSECEDSSWASKYAPESAAEVLQSGQEAYLLRNWLEALKVQSVDTGSLPEAKPLKAKSGPKKKRKRAKLDGFVVSSDDETYDLDEMTDPEDSATPKQTVVQNGGQISSKNSKDSVRLANLALISGPHGSGKTAAVYAVAKELGFEIFEINASTRRNGKDIMEKVGDMTRNHLVQHHQEDGKANDNRNVPEDQTAKDIKSGKQGTVMSFFKPKTPASNPTSAPASTPATPTPVAEPAPAVADKDKETARAAPPKAQKQSLILLEEVDILYEEDKQFWTTITTLVAQSKRPFIMTCNDESLVPFQNLNLYGIFRFSPPPEDLAVDLLLLAAANEGHALRRSPVEALLQARSGDLRASLTELNFWCQLGVGDRRGGVDWFYPRWPRGCDKDENGDVVRVISQDTYLEGMGWLGRDSTMQHLPVTEAELLSQTWDGFQVDLGDWQNTVDVSTWAGGLVNGASCPRSRLAALEVYANFSEGLSAADICSDGCLGLGFEETLDPTQPEIPAKTRDDYILGRKLLEAPILADYVQTSAGSTMALKSQARQLMQRAYQDRGFPVPVTMTGLHEPAAVSQIRDSVARERCWSPMTRRDISLAFDPIAASERQSNSSSGYLEPSVFDRTMRLITLDVAPYVRSIVAYERWLADERRRQGGLVSEGGRPGKRQRQTRVAMSAGEGPGTLRRESHFRARLNPYCVMRTAGEGWYGAVLESMYLNDVQVAPAADISVL